MVKLVVAYGKPDDPAAFDQHYVDTHAPLAQKIPNLRRFEAGKVLGTPDGSPAPYYFIAELLFDDAAAMQAGLASPEGQATAADVPNYASGGVTLMIAEAAQRYGIYVAAKGVNIAFFGQDPSSTGTNPYTGPDGYFAGKTAPQLLASFPWNHLQLLKMELHSGS